METTVVLSRKMGEFEVTQRTSDGYFNANALLTQWNSVKENPTKKMAHFMENANTNEFIDTIQSRNSDNADFQSLIISKGRMTINGRTQDKVWMHPFLFIDFSMWLSPEFKYDVIKFVYDELIKQRNDAGDAYKELASAIVKITPKKEIPTAMTKIAQALNFVCTNRHEREMRNQMDEPTMKEMVRLEHELTLLINEGYLTTIDSAINYLRRKWNVKYRPQLFA